MKQILTIGDQVVASFARRYRPAKKRRGDATDKKCRVVSPFRRRLAQARR